MRPINRFAAIQASDRVISFISRTGYTFGVAERGGFRKYLSADALDAPVGEALVEALANSRVVTPNGKRRDFFQPQNVEKAFVEWLNDLVKKHGYASHDAALEQMEYIRVEMAGGVIALHPYRHQGGDKWEQLVGANFTVPENAGSEAIGAAVRMALSRCAGAA